MGFSVLFYYNISCVILLGVISAGKEEKREKPIMRKEGGKMMKLKRAVSSAVAYSLAAGLILTGNVLPVAAEETDPLPEAEYIWDFENVDGTDAGNGASLMGAAEITDGNEDRGKVLNLSGGGNGSAYLQLPAVFENVTDEGFTLSMWVNVSGDNGNYEKIFSASPNELGATSSGNGNWELADFALATGGNVYDMTLFAGAAGTSVDLFTKLNYDTHLSRNLWQHMIVSVSPDSYAVYFNGKEVGYEEVPESPNTGTTGIDSLSTVLAALFQDDMIQSYSNVAIGRSQYTSDNDFKGQIDNVRFYTTALTEDQAAELYALENPSEDETSEVPDPVYIWDFEGEDQTEALHGAQLSGDAAITDNSRKGNNVLKLSGDGYMSLPEGILGEVSSENNEFTLSMWINASSETGEYTKYFDASNSPLGQTYDGGNVWASPDLALAAGSGSAVYDATFYVGNAGEAVGGNSSSKIKFDSRLTRNKWEHISVAFSADEFHVYLNGEEIGWSDAQQGTTAVTTVLNKLFNEGYIEDYRYASIGQSFYTSDADFSGMADDISFYDIALNESQAKSLYDSFEGVDTSVPPQGLSVDFTDEIGPIRHGATGFLYGLSDENVPNVNLLTPIKPSTAEQNAPDGLQHPSGDSIKIADTFLEGGGATVQVACQDIYANWPYEYTGDLDEYAEKLRTQVRKVRDAGLSDVVVYVPLNESDGNWYTGKGVEPGGAFFDAWDKLYKAIKETDPDARIAGTNLSCYRSDHVEYFMQYAAEHNCIPDQFTWHVLADNLYMNFPENVAEYRAWEKEYWIDTGLIDEPLEIVINEYANPKELGVPGELVRWLGLFEDEKVTACLAYWHISNNLSDIAADNNLPNGAWWLYKWYGAMSGNTVAMEPQSASKLDLYGVASVDDNKKIANVIFGGADGDSEIILKNIGNTEAFKNAEKVTVTLEATGYTGLNGAAEEPYLIKKEIVPVDENGNAVVTVDNMFAATAYNITITEAGEKSETGVVEEGSWRQIYEGEEARMGGNARLGTSTSYASSGAGQAQFIDMPTDSVTFDVEVPEDGYYQLDLVYGAATGNNTVDTVANNGLTGYFTRTIDSGESKELILPNTLTWFMAGQNSEIVYLTKGSHTIEYRGTDHAGKATIDCIYLTYKGTEEPVYGKTYEAELADFNVLGDQESTTVTTKSDISGYSASGYVTGVNTPVSEGGGLRFTVYADENGMYDLNLRYASDEAGSLNYYLDNTALTLDKKIAEADLENTGGEWSEAGATFFLQKGINIIDIDTSSADVAVDCLSVKHADNYDDMVTVIEAESDQVIRSGDVSEAENEYASEGAYIAGIRGSGDGSNSIEFTYNAPEAGNYKMIVYQSNKELFGSHSYNAQMVDRYITIQVNGGDPFNVVFRNTYSDESFKTQIVDLNLNEGENTIKIYNDDTRELKNGVGGVNTCINYTPNLDRFDIVPAAASQQAEPEPPAEEADKSALEEVIARAGEIDLSLYTEQSVQTFNEALAYARQVLADDTLTKNDQAVVDEAVSSLEAAISGLEEIGEDPGGEEPGGEEPGGQEPGGEEPGGEEPGGQEPGGEEPGGEEPGGEEPGGQEPGGEEPGGQEPGGQEPGGEDQQPGGDDSTQDGNAGDDGNSGNTQKEDSAVKTGDTTPIALWTLLVTVSAAGCISVIVKKRKNA